MEAAWGANSARCTRVIAEDLVPVLPLGELLRRLPPGIEVRRLKVAREIKSE